MSRTQRGTPSVSRSRPLGSVLLSVTLSGRCRGRTPTAVERSKHPEEARRRRGQALDPGGLVHAGGYVVSLVVGVILAVANRSFQQDPTNQAMLLVGFSAFMGVGALIVAHRPDNAIGWLFSAIALLAFSGQLASEYTTYAYVSRPRIAAGRDPCRLVCLLVVVCRRCPGAGVHPLAVPDRSAALASLAAGRLAGRGHDGGLDGAGCPSDRSESGPGPAGRQPDRDRRGGEPRGEHGRRRPVDPLVLLVALAFMSLVIRFRRSRGAERQQLKWFTYAGVLLPLALLDDYLPAPVGDLIFGVVIVFLPVAAGIAILRYRAVRHRPADQPHAGLRAPHRSTRRRLRRRGPGPRAGVRRSGPGSAELGGGRRDPGRRGAVPAGPPPHPGSRGSPVQPPQVRCGENRRGVQRSLA
jgi:hypothetical protein